MRISLAAAMVALLVWGSVSSATLTSGILGDDGDGVITCSPADDVSWDLSDPADQQVTLEGTYNLFATGHVEGNLYADTDADPTLTLISAMLNDTPATWTAYHVNVYMDQAFDITAASVDNPNDWGASITTSPAVWTLGGGPGGVDAYVGEIDYTGGTPVGNGDTLQFRYTIDFSGATMYGFCQEMIPIPEPGTLLLTFCGVAGLLVLRRRSA